MKNLTTRYFCRKFHAFREETRFSLRYGRMRDCYDALLAGEAGDNSINLAIWVATRKGVMSTRYLRLFAIARSAAWVAAMATCWDPSDDELRTEMVTIWDGRDAAWVTTLADSVRDILGNTECREQLAILAEFGNPFK